ncbi:MAG TPA: MurR/RpiR family transcriptional regulator [Actinomycetota bacterium]|nr:MurR/RpiR family transcriptional regulator [Actinomycetota bacterium]
MGERPPDRCSIRVHPKEATHTSETIGEEVRERLGEMTPSERRVARTLLETYPTAGLESLPQLAEGAGVTGPTVLRFVRKIGFEGYPDFQRSLRREVQARTEGLPSLYRTKGGTQADEVLRLSHEAFTTALDATLASSSLDRDLSDVVALLSDPKRHLWFVGGRFSQLVASYLWLQMRFLRPGCALVGEAPERRRLDGLEIERRDVLCLFDYRRYQQDTVAVGAAAADRGAVVVAFTDPWLSPAVEHARHVLISHADSSSPFDSLLGAFALTEVIAAKAVVELGEAGRARVAEADAFGDGFHEAAVAAPKVNGEGATA